MRTPQSTAAMFFCLLLIATACQAAAADRWQYAVLQHSGPFAWRAGGKSFTATTNRQFPEFYKAVTGQAWSSPAAEFTEETLAKLLDGIGADGWELVQVELSNNNSRMYYFKRKL